MAQSTKREEPQQVRLARSAGLEVGQPERAVAPAQEVPAEQPVEALELELAMAEVEARVGVVVLVVAALPHPFAAAARTCPA